MTTYPRHAVATLAVVFLLLLSVGLTVTDTAQAAVASNVNTLVATQKGNVDAASVEAILGKDVLSVVSLGATEPGGPITGYFDFFKRLDDAPVLSDEEIHNAGDRLGTRYLSFAVAKTPPAGVDFSDIDYYAIKSDGYFSLWSFDVNGRNAGFVDMRTEEGYDTGDFKSHDTIQNPRDWKLADLGRSFAAIAEDITQTSVSSDPDGGLADFDEAFVVLANDISHVDVYYIKLDTTSNDVPEPATLAIWSLFGAGAAAVGAVRRRRGWTNTKRQAIYSVIDRHGV